MSSPASQRSGQCCIRVRSAKRPSSVCVVILREQAIVSPHALRRIIERWERGTQRRRELGEAEGRSGGNSHQGAHRSSSGPAIGRGGDYNLVNAATSLLYRSKVDCHLKSLGLTPLIRIGPGKVRVTLARKIAILLLRLWKPGRHFDPSIRLD